MAMEDERFAGDLMGFADEDENQASAEQPVSWLSVLSELDQNSLSSNPFETEKASSNSLPKPSKDELNSLPKPSKDELDSLQWVYPSTHGYPTNTNFNKTGLTERPNHLLLNSSTNIKAQGYHWQTPTSGENSSNFHSEGSLSPIHSASKISGVESLGQGSTTKQRSQTPPLALKLKKFVPTMQETESNFIDSQGLQNQFALQMNFNEPQKSKPTNEFIDNSGEKIELPDSICSATDSIGSTGSFHPYDSISLKRNLSIRSFQSNDSDVPSSARSLMNELLNDIKASDKKETEIENDRSHKDLIVNQNFDFDSLTNVQSQPLQVKLPNLDTEEMEFFGRQSLEKTMPSPPRRTRAETPHRYSVGDNHKIQTSESAPDISKKPTFGGSLFEVAKERDLEVVAFGQVLSDLRRTFQYQDASNRGFVLSPALPPSFGEEAYDLDTEIPVVIYTESRNDTIRFSINVHKPVCEVIELTISCLSENVTVTDSSICEAFLLKVCGKSEYLEAERELVDYEHVQQCLKLQTEVRFVLIESDRISRPLARSAEDDKFDLIPRTYKDFFDLAKSTAISQYGLTILMEAFNEEVAKVLQEATDLVAPRFEPIRLIQSVKAMCAMLASIETSEIHSAVDDLVQLQQRKESINGAPLPPDSDSISCILTRLSESVLILVEMYCEAFDTDFTACKIYRPGLSGTFEVTAMTENLRLRIASAHRLPFNWKQDYEHFEVNAGIYYGGSLLCPVEITPLTKITKKFLEHLRWDEWLEFKIQVRQLPRESRLCLTLYGVTSMTKGNAVHTPRVPLGWVGMQLFNFNGVLASGTQMLGLWPDAKANPVGACTSNLLHPASVIILVEFERYLAEIVFPECNIAVGNDDLDMPEADYGIYEQILEKDLFNELKPEEKEVLWHHRYYCRTISRALPLVLSTVTSWEYKYLPEIYRMLDVWTPMFPVDAMELLKVNFPDRKVRAMAVRWMGNFSDDELCDYLPQLVQALKYEIYHDSPLARFLVRRALGNVRLMHLLFWYLKDKINEPQFGQRFQVILGGLLTVCGEAQREEFTFQDELVAELIKVAQKVKNARDSSRSNVLQQELAALAGSLPHVFHLPLTPSMEVSSLDVQSSGYFTSNSAPLRLNFKSADPFSENVNVIFKMGDDMRQDTLTMQLVGIMSKIWFREGLDLKMITYQCMATGPAMGMIEMVTESQTLREIHTEFGLTGSFKDEPIARWLLKHNPVEKDYRIAVNNFIASCAGYCVATYVLGICDRHNDNIMIRRSGHLFHIDFAKILGHAQMFGAFRRDRAPFVLTSDMAFVINGGYQPSSRFQHFVDLCCKAFNLVRRHANLFLNLLSLMLNSGIPSLSSVKDLTYIRDSLMPNASEADATAAFTRLINTSLSSMFTQVNFFIHNVAQIRDVSQTFKRPSTSNPNSVLSFAPKTYTVDTDGYIDSARVVDIQKRKRHNPGEKYYVYVINVCRVMDNKPTFLFRRFEHFQQLHSKLTEVYPEVNLPRLPSKIYLGRSQIRTVAERRRAELDDFLQHLLMMPSEISESEVIYTFLHSLLIDEEEASKFSIQLLPEEKATRVITGQIKLSLRFECDSLRVMVMHAKDLSPRNTGGLADPYVKLYLLPDPEKVTKIKTKVAKRTLNPTYNEKLVYSNRHKVELERRQLQVTVWDHDRVGENDFLGGVLIDLANIDLTITVTRWYDLVDLRK